MDPLDPLTTALLDLQHELGDQEPLTVGGGFGLFLKRRHLEARGARLLFDELPEPRATNDLDLFIRAEVLASYARTLRIKEAIERLGYEVVQDVKFLHWKQMLNLAGRQMEVKIDLLVGPLGEWEGALYTKKPPRVRPKRSIELHAHRTEEAVGIDDSPLPIPVTGKRSNGEPHQVMVCVPRPFPYLMMKLHAFHDRKDDADKQMGQHHALDLFTIVGMLTADEYDDTFQRATANASNSHVQTARRIVYESFSAPTSIGVLRIREHHLYRPEFRLHEFIDELTRFFPSGGKGIAQ